MERRILSVGAAVSALVATSNCVSYSDYDRSPVGGAAGSGGARPANGGNGGVANENGGARAGGSGGARPANGGNGGVANENGGARAGGTGGATGRDASSSDGSIDGAPSVGGAGGGGSVLREGGPDAHRDAPAEAAPPIRCGLTTRGNETDIDFGCPAILDDFTFFTPVPYDPGPGFWGWSKGNDGNGLLIETGNVRSFPASALPDAGYEAPPEMGTLAVFAPDIPNGSVSVFFKTSDGSCTLDLMARYSTPLGARYHLALGFANNVGHWTLRRYDPGPDDADTSLASGVISGFHNWAEGHRLGLRFVGNKLTPSYDGTSLGEVFDASYSDGQIAIDLISCDDAQLDDMVVTREPATDR
jgi:hypothetical protein